MNTYLVDLRMSYDTTPEVIGARSPVEAADLFVRAARSGTIFIGDIRNVDRGLDVQTVPVAQHGVMKMKGIFVPAADIPALNGQDYVHVEEPRDPEADVNAVLDVVRPIVAAYASADNAAGSIGFLEGLGYEIEQFTGADVVMSSMTVYELRALLEDGGIETTLTDEEIHTRLVAASFVRLSDETKAEIDALCVRMVTEDPADHPIIGV